MIKTTPFEMVFIIRVCMSIAVPLYGFGGSGGGTGGTLAVTAPAGVTVTVAKDGKTYTKTANASGLATFRGLATGTWTVTITDGSQTATQTVAVNTDYAVTMAFFAATISVTYPSGSACTCSDGTTTLTAPDTSGSCVFTVPNAGTWTVSCTDGTDTASDTVSITADGQSQSVELDYKLYIYKSGNECISVTGGWTTDGYIFGGYTLENFSTDGDTLTIVRDGAYIAGGGTANAVDLTDINTLYFNASEFSGNPLLCAVAKTKTNSNGTPAAEADVTATGITAMDVSSLTGNYYIFCAFVSDTGSAKISEIYGE